MSRAAVKLSPFFIGPQTLTLSAGEDGLAFLIPVAEPLSAGAPPHAPDLVGGISLPYRTRAVRCRSGHVVSAPLETAVRPTAVVRWTGRGFADRQELLGFLLDDCGDGLLAFDVEIDGPGGPVVTLRQLGQLRDSWDGRPAWSIEVDAEEVF